MPGTVRRNDDPVFASLDPRGSPLSAIFAGTVERRVLADGEDLMDLMEAAARAALADARTDPAEIDRLIGYESVSENLTPNGLFLLHRRLGLRRDVMVLPINCEFSNFLLGVSLAREAAVCGAARTSLVVCGSNWTRHVNYTQPHAVMGGDGAGAAVVGATGRFEVVDYAVETDSASYELWTMRARGAGSDGRPPTPTYEISPDAKPSFAEEAIRSSSRLASDLLARNRVSPADVTLVPHQTKALVDGWSASLSPRAVLHTYETLGNLSHASIPVTLALRAREITTPYLLFIAAGTGSHFAAMLLRVGP